MYFRVQTALERVYPKCDREREGRVSTCGLNNVRNIFNVLAGATKPDGAFRS